MSYQYTQPAYTHRFGLTIEVQTPHGLRSGSSVIETSAWESGNWGPIEARGIRRDFKVVPYSSILTTVKI
jgi:hypothetical protein